MQHPTIAFVTTSKGRLHHIQQTLPLIVAERPDQIIVVDYDCPQKTGEWVAKHYHQVKVVRVKGDPGFCLPLARNAGSQAVKSEWVFFVDADVQVQPGLVNWMRANLKTGGFYRAGEIDGQRDFETYGSFVCNRKDFSRIGGFDEAFRGWGGEDSDIFIRLAAIGLDEREYPHDFVSAIPHQDDERTTFHPVKEKDLQGDINAAYLALKQDLTRIDGNEPSLNVRKALMKRVRDVYSDWSKAGGAAQLPEIDINFQGARDLKFFKGYRLQKRLILGVEPAPMTTAPKVAIVTTCKGRLSHLSESLPLMLEQGADEVVVVDYGCPEGTGDWVEETHPAARVLRVSDDPGFCLARARNLGAAACTSEWICFLDADSLAYAGWLEWLRPKLIDSSAYFQSGASKGVAGGWDITGSVCVPRRAFEAIGGYDEVFRTWGVEDLDFYERLNQAGWRRRLWPAHFVDNIAHADTERTAHYAVKDKVLSNLAGRHYCALKQAAQQFSGRPLPEKIRRDLMAQALAQAQGFDRSSQSWLAITTALETPEEIVHTHNGSFRVHHDLTVRLEPLQAPPKIQAATVLKPHRRVVMFHVGRAGSSVLGDMLAQHPEVYWERELYEKMFAVYESRYGSIRLGDPRCPIRPFNALRQAIAYPDANVYGLEVKFFHLTHTGVALEDYVAGLKRFGFDGWIVLRRRNLLRVVASAIIAASIGRYHARLGDCAYGKRAIQINPHRVINDRQERSLLDFLNDYTENFGRLENLLHGTDSLLLTYEDDIEHSPVVAYQRIVDYLGLPKSAIPQVRLSRTNPYPLREMISNLDEVRAYLHGTPYEWMAEA